MSAGIKPRRSLLFVPTSNTRALEKARGLAADVIILDLEDAVATSAKELAREQAERVIMEGFNGREIALRINGIDTPWFADDMALIARATPAAVLLPKVSSPEALRGLTHQLDALGVPQRLRVWAMIETARAVIDADAIARSRDDRNSRLDLLMLGTNDLAHETGARMIPGRLPFLGWLQSVLLAARANGLAVIDAVYNNFSDTGGFAEECNQARDLGFDGKSLIHPSQIDIANEVFGPSQEEIAEAHALISAFAAPENAGGGAVKYKGRMIEDLHVASAMSRLALAEAIHALHSPK
ncbi:HpcH/HpaI aldolase/citrate lyase family protein [Pseudochelatococcus sp. G4_1912]|uniref:HpcH/HpaI aldolase/citrate lyase family protein n=1 Tax=Pseudochelatococcus sp. G4_1912 TaxID=3114288 RepID=UPI0039C719C8